MAKIKQTLIVLSFVLSTQAINAQTIDLKMSYTTIKDTTYILGKEMKLCANYTKRSKLKLDTISSGSNFRTVYLLSHRSINIQSIGGTITRESNIYSIDDKHWAISVSLASEAESFILVPVFVDSKYFVAHVITAKRKRLFNRGYYRTRSCTYVFRII